LQKAADTKGGLAGEAVLAIGAQMVLVNVLVAVF